MKKTVCLLLALILTCALLGSAGASTVSSAQSASITLYETITYVDNNGKPTKTERSVIGQTTVHFTLIRSGETDLYMGANLTASDKSKATADKAGEGISASKLSNPENISATITGGGTGISVKVTGGKYKIVYNNVYVVDQGVPSLAATKTHSASFYGARTFVK